MKSAIAEDGTGTFEGAAINIASPVTDTVAVTPGGGIRRRHRGGTGSESLRGADDGAVLRQDVEMADALARQAVP